MKKKIANFLDKELPLLMSLFPDLSLTKIGKNESHDTGINLTEFSNIYSNSSQATKISNACNISDDKGQNFQSNQESHLDLTVKKGNLHLTRPKSGEIDGEIPKYYINNPLNLMKSQSSGGVEAATTAVYSKQNSSSHTVRLSISPSQGDDPGFKSRPEHSFLVRLSQVWAYF
jgi:hypothetical protein